ncbi:MAG: assimilatory sulfite reductase (NADPH) flavoprotein subunit [Gammaproteobacteria bacterium]|nr:assimilatory sulfite reductase (NADPH) flavoprotein subunit [Gammaproteobacteria bacterium]
MSSLPAGEMPLDIEQTRNLQTAVQGLSEQQLHWVSGYAAGLAAGGSADAAASPAPIADVGQGLTILYGSQTGNGEEIATALSELARAKGFATSLQSLSDFKPSSLKRESLVTFVVSTHGEGDPPDDAEIFYDFLMSEKAPKLTDLNYSVLALGDSSYVNFCQTGRDFDLRLEELGATRFEAMVECDLDFETHATNWTERVIAELPSLLDAPATSPAPILRAVENTSIHDKKNPFPAEILVNQKITAGGSSKDVRHIELSLEGSGLTYEPGDALGVFVENPPQLVEEIIASLRLDETANVRVGDQTLSLQRALQSRLEITTVSVGFLRAWAEIATAELLHELLAAGAEAKLSEFLDRHQLVDMLRAFPAVVDAQVFVELLRALSPRSYSIASSPQANPDEVHLTVAEVRYQAFGSEHWGAASTHLVDRLKEGDTVDVFIERNKRFRLPEAHVPVIMIGPGTGVAPFRAFVEERVELGASGNNWLIFGDRNFDTDFLYQLEWQRHLKQGNLQRLDVAFSRDQHNKIYVQDRIRDNAAEIARWIDQGAVIYVCGDAKRMAGDVDDALRDVLAAHMDVDAEAAEQQLKALRAAGRYQRDVY